MKVKEVLAQMRFENPEAEVVPGKDDRGHLLLMVAPPEHAFGDPMQSSEEARAMLGSHIERMEKVRMGIALFFGLPVRFKINSSANGEWLEFVVKSPTGRTIGGVEVSIGYVVRKDESGWRKETLSYQSIVRFKETAAELAGYRCHVQKSVAAGEKLAQGIDKGCEAPKWLEIEQDG